MECLNSLNDIFLKMKSHRCSPQANNHEFVNCRVFAILCFLTPLRQEQACKVGEIDSEL
jgi:hypothetical protein